MVESVYKNRIIYSWMIILLFSVNIAFNIHLWIQLLVIFALSLACFFYVKRPIFDISDAFLTIGMSSFVIISDYTIVLGSVWIAGIAIGIGVLAAYQLGKTIVYTSVTNCVDLSKNYIIILVVSFFVSGICNHAFLIKDISLYESGWPAIGMDYLPKTQHEFYLIPVCSLFLFWIFLCRKKLLIGYLGIIISLVSLIMATIIRERMVLCCTFVTTIIVIFLMSVDKNVGNSKLIREKACFGLIVMVILFVLYCMNVGGVREWYTHSKWFNDGGILNNVRFRVMWKSIKLLKDYPWGNCHVSLTVTNSELFKDYAHNTWLDIGRRAGIIPMLLILGFSVFNLIAIARVWIREKELSKYALISCFVAVTLYNMFEPAIIANLMFWIAEAFLGGIAMGISGIGIQSTN